MRSTRAINLLPVPHAFSSTASLSDKYPMRTALRLFPLLLACLSATAAAQTAPASPLPGSRAIKTFDFEELSLGNFESTPMFWSKVVGRGFPAYSTGAFDHTIARSANTSFKLQTTGGSVAYRLAPPAGKRIPIYPDADYYILAFVRTSQLKYAKADLAAWFADDQGQLLLDSEAHCQAYHPAGAVTPAADADAWQVLYIYMPGPVVQAGHPAKAKSLVLQVGVMQPQQLAGAPSAAATKSDSEDLGRFALYQQDIKGAAWFDDIVVFQLPRISVNVKAENSTSPARMFGIGEPIELDLLVSDLTDHALNAGRAAENLTVRLRVTDADGLVFATDQWKAASAPEKAWTQHFSHAPLPAGLYSASMEVLDAGDPARPPVLIARRQTQFLCLPEQAGTTQPPAREFGLGVTAWSAAPESWRDLPLLLRQTGAGTLQLPAWRRDMTEDALTRRDPPFDALVAALRRTNTRTIAALSELPSPIAKRLGGSTGTGAGTGGGADGGGLESDHDSILSLLNADPVLWRPAMAQLLTRLADRIDLWELGSPEIPLSGALPGPVQGEGQPASGEGALRLSDERSAALFNGTYTAMAGLMSQPKLVIPWNALVDFDPRQFPHAMLDLGLPAVIKPSQIPAYLASFREAGLRQPPAAAPDARAPARGRAGIDTPGETVSIIAHLEGLSLRETSRQERLADFAQRIVYARAAAPEAILFDAGNGTAPSSTTGAPHAGPPDELLLVYRAMIHALGGSTFAGELPLSRGVRGFLFKKPGGPAGATGTLVLWHDSAKAADDVLDLPLGSRAVSTDLLGNARPLQFVPETQLTHVAVGSTPVVIEQIDPRPLQLRTSFALSTPNLPAGAGAVRTEVLLANAYNEPLTGSLRLQLPKGWTAEPSILPVVLAPGASLRQAVTLRYPFTENAGPKEIGARFTPDVAPPGNPIGLTHLDLIFPVAITSEQVEMEGFTLIQSNGDISLQQVITNISGAPLDGQAYALLPGFPRQQRYIVGLQPGQTTVKRFIFPASTFIAADGKSRLSAAEITKFMAQQSATLGIRQNDGKTLLTKAIPFE